MSKTPLDEYYNLDQEDIRLFKDKKHQTEYILTNHYIDKYLNEGMKILEIGVATGAYSLNLAKKGYEVHALDPVKKNIDILKSKIESGMNIHPVLGNALNLSMYEENMFDMVLNFGPMYHLGEEDRYRCMEESIRVTKPNGLIYVAYISNNFTFVSGIKKFDRCIINHADEIREGFKIVDSNNLFTFMFPDQMELLASKYDVEKLHHLATDGISRLIEEKINDFTDHEFKVWIDYLKQTAEREDQLGYSEHLLFICRKR